MERSHSSLNFNSMMPTMNFPEYQQILKSVMRADALLTGQRRVLELLAKRAPLFEILHLLVSILEEQYEGILCSILLVDEKTQTFKEGVAVNHGNNYLLDVSGVTILPPYLGPCCQAAHLGKLVVSEDIASGNWADRWKEWAANNELKTCRSHPIFSSTGDVLGTFAMYHKNNADPALANLYQIELATHIAGIAIERKQIEARELEWRQKMQQVNKELSRAIQLRDEFFRMTTHELNSPLANMKMWTTFKKEKILDGEVCDKDTILSLLETHEKQLDKVIKTVRTITDTSYLKYGYQNLNVTKFDINVLLKDVLDRLKTILEQNECLVEFNLKESFMGEWDQVRLEQVFTNLITNAVKYCEGPGRIHIKTEKVDDHKIRVLVKDNGVGIDPKDHNKIFERYERVGDNVKESEGLGLGLYIVREIIGAHQGSVTVESELGKGATFIVELPLGRESSLI